MAKRAVASFIGTTFSPTIHSLSRHTSASIVTRHRPSTFEVSQNLRPPTYLPEPTAIPPSTIVQPNERPILLRSAHPTRNPDRKPHPHHPLAAQSHLPHPPTFSREPSSAHTHNHVGSLRARAPEQLAAGRASLQSIRLTGGHNRHL
jgi:hypothetical protein